MPTPIALADNYPSAVLGTFDRISILNLSKG
jgi:hypothetical protein